MHIDLAFNSDIIIFKKNTFLDLRRYWIHWNIVMVSDAGVGRIITGLIKM